jgi:16S rRNA (uracil1498-N3)-methyltransferase
VASSIPKGGRADWMVEKLSELGAAALVPLTTARGVVKPAGENKADRWRRIATESAKQSHRVGVMRIAAVSSVDDALASAVVDGESAVWMTPDENAASFADVMDERAGQKRVTIFIGPEGGWDEREAAGFRRGGAAAARFGRNILRTETAAITAAGWVALRRLKAE